MPSAIERWHSQQSDLPVLIRALRAVLFDRYHHLCIFGSVSRNEQTENSDIDVCVETQTPNPFLLASLKDYLESIFKCSVDVVRMHKNINPLLKSRIERDGIYAVHSHR